ncbi:4-aminobutyrate--2-oxoglutarate transaminase [Malassezia yamatoensis]|uniref:4-aminobutyrate--2-oxoglutarate transaminase n=1 Tax=Malassezia yamatoensis TaxID=253288 RepID=A0AAJ5YRS7_9BASI|nr:4-aminobutyrate--2-oxoglutarate transaminase [Malassezia yamatoensis]
MAELAQFAKEHISKGIGRQTDFVFEEGNGCYVTTADGKKLLDLSSGIGVVNLGHCHPTVTEYTQKQCAKLIHAQVNIAFSGPQIDLIKDLQTIMPSKELDTYFLANSGSEAVEGAVRIARHSTKRQNIIVVQGSYHGRTAAAAAMTRSKTAYSAGVGPLMPCVYTTPFPYYSQLLMQPDASEDQMADYCLQRLRMLLQQETAPQDTAGIFVETVLGEGGYVPAPAKFLHGVREICDEHGILFVADEIQSGYGRTGKMFAVEHSGVVPDLMTIAKGIANGFPLSAVVGKKKYMDAMPPASLGGTYTGNAVACAAGRAVVKVFREDKVLDNVAIRSKQFFDGLAEIRKKPHGKLIEDVRGAGLMIGIQFKSPTKEQVRGHVVKGCMDRHMIILSTSVFDVLRLIPPLTISEKELAEALRILDESIADAGKHFQI